MTPRNKRSLLKVIMLGDSGVGKTSLLNKYIRQSFTTTYKATIGADFYTKEVAFDDTVCTLQVWDTVGQERFQSLGVAFYRGADCVVLVYDVTSLASLQSLEVWKNEFLIHGAPKDPNNFPFVVMGNKIDLGGSGRMCRDAIQNLLLCDYQVPCFETSAKDGTNVAEAFRTVARRAVSLEKDDYLMNSIPESIRCEEVDSKKSNRTVCIC